jgi:hypothetical protein
MFSIDDIFKRANSTGRSLSSAGAGERSFITCRDRSANPKVHTRRGSQLVFSAARTGRSRTRFPVA